MWFRNCPHAAVRPFLRHGLQENKGLECKILSVRKFALRSQTIVPIVRAGVRGIPSSDRSVQVVGEAEDGQSAVAP